MRFGRWAWLVSTAIPFLAGCAGFWQSPTGSSSGGCTTNCSTASSGNFYILNAGSPPGIAGESFVSGKVTAITGSPWSVPSTPSAMSITPTGNFLYVSTTAGVYVYPISSGALGTAVQVSQDVAALAIHVDTTDTWLIEAIPATGGVTLAAVPISASNGASSGTEQTATYTVTSAAVQSGAIAISADNKFVFVALGTGGVIAVPFNAAVAAGNNPFGNTAFTIPVVKSGGSALSVAVDPAGRLFYVGETLANSAGTSGGLLAYNLSSLGSAQLTQATGSPIASGGLAPNAILPSTSGTYVYVANGQGTTSAGNVTSFAISAIGTIYTIATGSSATAGTQPVSLARDSSGTFLLEVNALGSSPFESYTFDSTTPGTLDIQVVANTGSAPLAVVATP